jgi:signal transduction histidine kinase
MNKNRFLLFLLLVFSIHTAESGQPFMTIYTSKEIEGHTQFWAMEQDNRGVMYIGDGYGVQEFDGSNWRAIINPNHSFGRSLDKDAHGRIYVGSSGMLGYLDADQNGQMYYRSLMEFLKPEDQVFNYVWSVQATSAGIYFQTHEKLFRFRPEIVKDGTEHWNVDVWRARNLFGYTFWFDQTLYVQQFGIGLTKMVNDSLVQIPGGEQFANDRVHVMLPFPGKPGAYVIGTFSRGLFLWDGNTVRPFPVDDDPSLRRGTVYTGVITPDSCFALGTMASGLYIIDANGRTRHHFSQASGLLSNTVSCLFVDMQKNLWMGMDGGVAVLEYNSPLSEFNVPGGTGPSDFRRYQGVLYIATNDGVYFLDETDSRLKMIDGIVGNAQSFFFREINNELFIAVNQGVYRIQNKTAVLALPNRELSRPVLNMCEVSLANHLIVAGTSDGVELLRYDANDPHRLRRISNVAGTHEYIRNAIEIEPGVVWLGTMDSGIIRLTLQADQALNPVVEKFSVEHGLPIGGVSCYLIDGKLVYCTKQGIYQFDDKQKRFARDPNFDGVQLGRNPDEGIIVADSQGNIWMNLGKESAVYRKLPNGTYRLEKDQMARFADEVINIIYPDVNGLVWFGTANNVVRIAPSRYQTEQVNFPALIRRVALDGDSTIYFGAMKPDSRLNDQTARVLPFRDNAVRFDFSASSYLNPRANEFRTKLEGFDNNWSPWSNEHRRYYTNLPAGTYRFRVKARNIFQHESSEDVFAFTIKPPLYGTWWAWMLYVLGAGGLIIGYLRVRTRQLKERSRLLEKIVQERTAEIQAQNKEIQAQKENVEQLSRIGRDITATLSIENIIHTVYENVNSLMDASVFGIGIYNSEKQSLDFPSTIENNTVIPAYSVSLADENLLAVWCFKNQKDVVINDFTRDFAAYINKIQTTVAGKYRESILYLPLTYKDKTIGVITAQSFAKNAYTDYHLHMLQNLATYCAIALDNADAYRRLAALLDELKATQEKLVTQSKLAALGALTAGIAHEIKNPLNFVNNFSALIVEMVEELKEILEKEREHLQPDTVTEVAELLATMQQNASKIREHGTRADSIVRSMLQHSRGKAGERKPTDINVMLEEDINLAYHGMRAQDGSFNITIDTDLDRSISLVNIVPQDISRVFLNIVSNGFYEAHRKKQNAGGGFAPKLIVKTRNLDHGIEISIRDNGNGVPASIRSGLFTPFFTTKPTGQGIGLGLSISHDIVVQGHNGQLFFETEEGAYTEFIIRLPK